jgi:hypothetical protein
MIQFRHQQKFGSGMPLNFFSVNSGRRQVYGSNGMDGRNTLRYRARFVGIVGRKANSAASTDNRRFADPDTAVC